MRARLVAARAALLLPLAAVLVALLARSSLLRLAPLPLPAALAYAAGALGLALVPALLAARSPLPGALAVTVPVLAAASYEQSRLDWLRVLKDYGVADPGAPDALRLALGAAALLLAWALHVADASMRMRADATARGLPAEQARAAARRVRATGARLGGAALLGAAGIVALAAVAARLDATALLGGRASLLAPLVAAVLVAAAAIVLWRGEGRRSPDE